MTNSDHESPAYWKPPTAIISYAHELAEPTEPGKPPWKAQALNLAAALRDPGGVDVDIDQLHEHKGTDWGRYGPTRCQEADFVICLASPSYKVAWSTSATGTDSGQLNQGARAEASAIQARCTKSGTGFLIWVVLGDRTSTDLPQDQSNMAWVSMPSVTIESLQSLFRRIHGVPNVALPTVAALPRLATLPVLAHPVAVSTSLSPKIVGALPDRHPYFTGREGELSRLLPSPDDAAATNVIKESVSGMGGMGKSELTVEYAYKRMASREIKFVAFIVAGSEGTFADGVSELAQHLGVERRSDEEQRSFVSRVRDQLESNGHGTWLMILDNVEPDVDIKALLPRIGTGQVLITTRDATLHDQLGAKHLTLDELDDFTSRQLIVSRIGADAVDKAALDALVRFADGLPLALDLISTQLAFGVPPERVLRKAANASTNRRHATIESLWQSTVERLNEPARRMLNLAVMLAPDDLPLTAPKEPRFDPLFGDVEDAVDDLVRWSLLKRTRNGNYSIHRLLRQTVRSGLSEQTQAAATADAAVIVKSLMPADATAPAAWPVIASLEPHAIELFEASLADPPPIQSTFCDIWCVVDRAASSIQYGGDAARATPLFRKIHRRTVEVLGARHPDSLRAKANYANSLWALGHAGHAAELDREVLADRVEVLGARHPDTLMAKANYANSLRALGDPEQAAEFEREVLADRVEVLGLRHPDTLRAKANYAGSLWALGDEAQAAELQREVLSDRVEVLGLRHPDTLRAKANYAHSLWALGDAAQAATLQREVLADRVKVLGESHPDTLTTQNNLANSLWDLGEADEAIAQMRLCVEGRQAMLPDHAHTAASLACLNSWLLGG